MRSFKGLLAALFFFVAACFLNAAVPEQIPRIVWHVLKIEPGDSQTRALLAGSGFEIIGTTPDGALKVLANSDQRQWLESLGVKTAVLIYDYGRFLAEKNAEAALLAAADEFATGSMGGFFSPEEVLAFVDSLIASDSYGIISDTFHIGLSTWENPIWMVRVSGNSDGDENIPQVFYNSLIHSREAISMMTLLYFLGFIVQNYGVADSVTDLVDSRDLYFLPVFNPDGYEINWRTYRDENKFGLWRKNARDNDENGILDNLDGVDLNRNFDFMWGYNLWGSSNDKRMDNYRGPNSFSEPEAVAVRDFIRSHAFVTALNIHSYGPYLLNPFSYANLHTPDSLTYNRLGAVLTAENGYRYGNATEILGYPANGELTDWEYADTTKNEIIAWALEIGTKEDGFWPPANQITRLARENLSLLFTQARISGFWPQLDSLEQVADSSNSTRVTLHLRFSNTGLLPNREPVTLRLVEHGKGINPIDSVASVQILEAAFPPVFSRDSLKVVFEQWAFSSSVKLAFFEGAQRIRTITAELRRPGEPDYDLDGDGRTSIFDLIALLKVLSFGAPAGEDASKYDLTGDGKVDIFDLLTLLKELSYLQRLKQ